MNEAFEKSIKQEDFRQFVLSSIVFPLQKKEPNQAIWEHCCQAKEEYERVSSLSLSEAFDWATKDMEEKRKSDWQYLENLPSMDKIAKMLEKAEKWEPPTEHHRGIKDNMISRLQYLEKFRQQNSPKQHYASMLMELKKTADFTQDGWDREVEYVNEYNQWLEDLESSLPPEIPTIKNLSNDPYDIMMAKRTSDRKAT